LTAVGKFHPPFPDGRGLPFLGWLRKPHAHNIIEGTLEGPDECRRLPEESLPRPVQIGMDIEKPTPEKPFPRQIKHGRARSLIRLRGGEGVTQSDRQQHQKPTVAGWPSRREESVAHHRSPSPNEGNAVECTASKLSVHKSAETGN
jgi:hypothetical protein